MGHHLLLDPSGRVTIPIPAYLSCLGLSSTCHPCPQALCPCFYRTGPLNICTHLQLCYTILVCLGLLLFQDLNDLKVNDVSIFLPEQRLLTFSRFCLWILPFRVFFFFFLVLPRIFSYPKTVLPCTCCSWFALKGLSSRLSGKHRSDIGKGILHFFWKYAHFTTPPELNCCRIHSADLRFWGYHF